MHMKPEQHQETRLRELLGTAYDTMETKDGRDAIRQAWGLPPRKENHQEPRYRG